MAITALGMAGIAGGQSIVNQGLGMINQSNQAKYNKAQAKYQLGLDKEMAKYTYDLTNTTAQMKQLKANNLNPTLALGAGGAGGQTVSTGNSNAQGVGMVENKMNMGDAMQMSLLDAQKKNIEADTKLKESEAGTKGAEESNFRASTNKLIQEAGTISTLRDWEILERKTRIDMQEAITTKETEQAFNIMKERGQIEANIKNLDANTKKLLNDVFIAQGELEVARGLLEVARKNAETNETQANTEIYKAATERVNSGTRFLEYQADKAAKEWATGDRINTKQILEMSKIGSEIIKNGASTAESIGALLKPSVKKVTGFSK